ncbi:hypothetical protein Tco_1132238 [Tanacetum coccineum]|uniref:Uncharacterized protein n=1 Tax=Tanacetum coccineum TaxID=301880 RepID=A0ABQ5JE41_9ASTR
MESHNQANTSLTNSHEYVSMCSLLIGVALYYYWRDQQCDRTFEDLGPTLPKFPCNTALKLESLPSMVARVYLTDNALHSYSNVHSLCNLIGIVKFIDAVVDP